MKKFMKILGLCLALVLMLSLASCSMFGGDDADKKQTEDEDKDNDKKKKPSAATKIAFYDFVNESGNWCIYADGEIFGCYSTQGKLVVSGDSTFAYVIHGGDIDVLDANGSTLITEKAEEVYSLAALKVGAVYSDGDSVYAYTEEHGERKLDGASFAFVTTAMSDYIISADASVVVYSTEISRNDETSNAETQSPLPMPTDVNNDDAVKGEDTSAAVGANRALYVYRDGTLLVPSVTVGVTPIALSNDGAVMYARTENGELVVFNTTTWSMGIVSDSFNQLIEITSDGSEVVFSDEYFNTRIATVDIKSSALSVIRQAQLSGGEGVCTPLAPASAGYGFDTFAGRYFEFEGDDTVENAEESLYYVDKNYQTWLIARGEDIETDSELKHVYCLDDMGELVKIDFSDLNNIMFRTVSYNVVEYEVMASGNVYCLDDLTGLNYYDCQADMVTRIAEGVSEFNSYEYANTVYFKNENSDNVMFSKDGAEPEKLTVSGKSIMGEFGIMDTEADKAYALAYDFSSGNVKVYYTADGGASFTFLSNVKLPGLGVVR